MKYLEKIDNRIGILIGVGTITFTFLLFMIFFLVQNPIISNIGSSTSILYIPQHIIKSLFAIPLVLTIIAFIWIEYFLLRIIKSIQTKTKWTWRTKSKLKWILITFPSILMFVLIVLFFGLAFILGTTMSTYGYNGFTKTYLIILFSIIPIVIVLYGLAITPWISESAFVFLKKRIS